MLLKGANKMKKIFAIIIAVTMLTAALAVSVGAAKDVGGENGVLTFEPTTTPGQDLNVQVSEVTHKYAVDVEFAFDTLVIGGSIEWNVNTMKYEATGATLADAQRTITVDNRSDLPVYAYATVTDADANDFITVTADKDSAANKLTIAKATAGKAAGNGKKATGTITINIKGETWENAIAYYGEKKAAGGVDTFKVATVTVTISNNNTV